MKKITVLLADDHSIVRQGIRLLLEAEDDFEVVGEASNGLQAVEMAQELHPDVVVLDLAMPQLNGFEAARRILLESDSPPKILILSAHADDAYIEQVIKMKVHGYLVKQTSAHVLVKAIREIRKGRLFYSPSIDKRIANNDLQPSGTAPAHINRAGHRRKIDACLTTREREVLQLIAEGRANKEIADDLHISIKTVEKHRQNLMDKLKIHDTAGLTRYAISAGIIESCVQCTIS